MNKWIVNSPEGGERLLTFLRERLRSEFTTKNIRWAVEHHRCKVNGIVERFCSRRLKIRDCVEISMVQKPKFSFDSSRVLFENENLLFYHKPAGIPSEELALSFELFLVHRLDRDTSGVLLFAKTSLMQKEIEQLFRERKMKKSYVAIVKGEVKEPEGKIENYIAKVTEKEGEGKWGIVSKQKGSYAMTEWKLEKVSKNYSFIRCWPLTGRTHQIRLHLSSIGYPILGDLRYGDRFEQNFQPFRPLLHAEELSFTLHEEKMCVRAPLPKDFLEVLGSHFDWV